MKRVSYFEDIPAHDLASFHGGTLLLDVDHTLLPPSSLDLSQKGRDQILRIKEMGITVFLLSNGGRHERNENLAQSLGVSYIRSPYKKPNKKVLEGVQVTQPVLVIGDKMITDGIFAKRIKAPLLFVKRHTASQDSLFDTLVCFFDDVVSWVLPL